MNDSNRRFDRNARVAIWTEPLWSLFGTGALYYITFFMQLNGLSAVEIGIIISVNLSLSTLVQLVAGPLTDRLGRKRTTFIFDLASWVAPMLLWAVSSSFLVFLVAWILNSLSRIVNVSFNLLATENATDETRPRIFAAVKVISLLAGLLVPIVGLAMDAFGAEPALRVLFLAGAISMLAQNILRNVYAEETDDGVIAVRDHASHSIAVSFFTSIRTLVRSLGHAQVRRIFFVYAVSTFAFQLNVFLVPYLAHTLDIGAFVIAVIPAVTALVSLAVFVVVMPRVESRVAVGALTCGSAAAAALGWGLFLGASATTVWLLILSVAVSSAGTFALESYREALVINVAVEQDRAVLYAGVQTVTALVCIPTGLVAGLLYEASPFWLYVAIAACYALVAIAAAGRGVSQRIDVRFGELGRTSAEASQSGMASSS